MQHIVPNNQLIPIIEHDGETAVNNVLKEKVSA